MRIALWNRWWTCALLAAALGGVPIGSARAHDDDGAQAPSRLVIRTLSNRADLISDGDALVEVRVPTSIRMSRVKLSLNGVDVSAGFVTDVAARTLRSVVTGLRTGENKLVAKADARHSDRHHERHHASLTITNHPQRRAGPARARRPHRGSAQRRRQSLRIRQHAGVQRQRPDDEPRWMRSAILRPSTKLFYRTTTPGCSTRACPTRAHRRAQPTNNCFKPYVVGHVRRPTWRRQRRPPASRCRTSCSVERGTLNRGIYDIAVLFDPTQAVPWTALAPQAQWNGKVVYTLRRVDRPAASAISHRTELGR